MPFKKPFIGLGDESVFVVTAHMPAGTIVVGVAKSEIGAAKIQREAEEALAEEPALEFEITEMPVCW